MSDKRLILYVFFRTTITFVLFVARECQILFVVVNLSIPRHALHEKCFQRQKSFGPLVSSQDERALLFLLINRG